MSTAPVSGPNATPLSVQIQQAKQEMAALVQTLVSDVEAAAGVQLENAKSHLNNFIATAEEKLAALAAAHAPASTGNVSTLGAAGQANIAVDQKKDSN